MSRELFFLDRVWLGALAVVVFVATVNGQGGTAPSEANHFIGTPAGWVHPTTPWGDPDLQGMWPISFVGSVPLERCAGGGRGRPGGPPAPPCDPSKAFLTEEEYQGRLGQAATQVDRHAAAIAAGNFGQALQSGVTDPTFPQRQTSLIMEPPNGKLPELTPEGKRLSALMRSSWALNQEERLQQRRPDHAGARLRHPEHGDDPRGACDSGRWPPGDLARNQAVDG